MSYPLYGNVIVDSSNSTALGGTLTISNSCKTSSLNNQASIAFAVADISFGTLKKGFFNNNVDTADARITAIIDTVSPTVGTGLSLSVSSNHANPPVEALRVQSNGNVGIGTQTPQFPLDVNGIVRSTDVRIDNGNIHLGQSAGLTNQGTNAIAIGSNAGQGLTLGQGNNAIAIGVNSARTSQSLNAIAIGNAAGDGTQGEDGIAIGRNAGITTQGQEGIAIGVVAADTTQGNYGIAIGRAAGRYLQQTEAISIGRFAGQGVAATPANQQNTKAIAIGKYAGGFGQGANSISLGGYTSVPTGIQASNCIQINATDTAIAQTTGSSCIISPIRSAVPAGTQNSLPLLYNTTTREVFTSNEQSQTVVMTSALTTLTSNTYNRFIFISLNSNALNRLNLPTPVVTFPAYVVVFNGAVVPTAFELGTAAGNQIRVGGTTSNFINIAANTSITLHTNGTVWVRTATG